jgi:hypothetical protein
VVCRLSTSLAGRCSHEAQLAITPVWCRILDRCIIIIMFIKVIRSGNLSLHLHPYATLSIFRRDIKCRTCFSGNMAPKRLAKAFKYHYFSMKPVKSNNLSSCTHQIYLFPSDVDPVSHQILKNCISAV